MKRLVPAAALVALLHASPVLHAQEGADPAQAPNRSPTQVEVLADVPGAGKPILRGAYAVLHYSGFVYDADAPEHKGKRFVDSRERGETLSYKYGLQRAIPGLEKGMKGMRVGGKRTIVVPARLAYDGLKYPVPKDVPEKSAVVFDVELLEVVPEGAPPDQ